MIKEQYNIDLKHLIDLSNTNLGLFDILVSETVESLRAGKEVLINNNLNNEIIPLHSFNSSSINKNVEAFNEWINDRFLK